MSAKAYRSIPIQECGDALVAIPLTAFAFTLPHPYAAAGAPYGHASPWMLRQTVLDALHAAQAELGRRHAGWQLKLFDAYRPVAVQAFMVWREFLRQAAVRGASLNGYANPGALRVGDPALYNQLAETVFVFWSEPSEDPLTPPPHSTGAAIDLTLVDAQGVELDMGSPIDETSVRSYPVHFSAVGPGAGDPNAACFHERRTLLHDVMSAAGFMRHPHEWWHFSLGDQLWAWATGAAMARYGRVPELR
jgi:D-alanyl-D-alanine dipeptidase